MVYNHCIPSLHGEREREGDGEGGGRRREEDHSDTSALMPCTYVPTTQVQRGCVSMATQGTVLDLASLLCHMAPGQFLFYL